MASSGGSEYGIGSEGAPVVDRRQEVVGELRESEAKLLAGSAWAERVWRGGATVSSGSPACRVDGGAVLGSLGGEMERM